MTAATAPVILVTGSQGFVGGWAIAALRDRFPDASIVGTSMAADAAGLLPLDLRDDASVDAAVASARPDIVLHLAAISTVAAARNDLAAAFEVNLNGTMRLATAVLRHVPHARFLFVGSSDVYGGTFARWPAPLDEDAPLAPLNGYAASKAAADLLIGQMAVADGLRAIRLRPFNHTGPGQDSRFVVPSFARQLARIAAGRQSPSISVGNLEGSREFLDVRDIVRAYAAAASGDDRLFDGRIINLSSGRPIRIRTVLDRLIALSGLSVEVIVDPARFRPEEERFAGGNATRASDLLGWRPSIALDTTLREILDAACREEASTDR